MYEARGGSGEGKVVLGQQNCVAFKIRPLWVWSKAVAMATHMPWWASRAPTWTHLFCCKLNCWNLLKNSETKYMECPVQRRLHALHSNKPQFDRIAAKLVPLNASIRYLCFQATLWHILGIHVFYMYFMLSIVHHFHWDSRRIYSVGQIQSTGWDIQ